MALQFTDIQKTICQSLLNGPMSLETMAERTHHSQTELQIELKHLMQLKLVTLEGVPPLYILKEEVVQELKRRKGIEADDDNPFRVRILIEVQGIEEELVKRQVDKIIDNLRKEPFFKIYASTIEPIEKVEDKYSTFADVNLSVRDFRGLVRLMFFYGPASVEVIKPQKIVFELDDFQNGLVDMTEMVHAYADYIMGLLSRKKVEEFNAQFYQGM
ncbi:MAG: hypothetical protein V1776_01935, partial [Candidatus Diapherotrites archaeon]